MKKFFNSNKTVYIILCLVILAGICRFSYGFFVEKQGTHSDEEWSFGLANSYYEPYIYSSDDDNYDKNCNEWLSGEVLKNYLTVQKGERFSFGSVYYNMACDMHPPLYFFALHFLSSFFVDQYIPALGFIINVVCYIIMSIFLYRLLLIMSKSRYVGILGVIFNTFNVGTLSMVIFIRMYTMVTMFAVILAYYNAKLYYDTASRKKISTYIKLAIFTCLGALTHHFFLPYAFMLTAIMCICWMIKKEWHVLAKYAGFMILGVALSIAIFPATLDHMLGVQTFKFRDEGKYTTSTAQAFTNNNDASDLVDDTDTSYKAFTTDDIENYDQIIFKYYFFTCIYMVFVDIFGFSIVSPYSKGIMLYFPVALLVLIVLFFSFSFLFRKETFFIKLKKRFKTFLKEKTIVSLFKKFNWFVLSIIITFIFIVVICSYRVDISLMSNFTTRYLFIVYPIISILFVYITFSLFNKLFHNAKIYMTLFSIVIVLSLSIDIILATKQCSYFFPTTKNIEYIENLSTNSNIIIVSPSRWHMTIYAPLIYKCDSFIYMSNSSFFNQSNLLSSIDQTKKTYLFIDTTQFLDSSEDANDSASYSDMSTYNYNEVNTRSIILNKRLHNLNLGNKKLLYLDSYLNYLSKDNNIKYLNLITDAVDFGAEFNVYEITFEKE